MDVIIICDFAWRFGFRFDPSLLLLREYHPCQPVISATSLTSVSIILDILIPSLQHPLRRVRQSAPRYTVIVRGRPYDAIPCYFTFEVFHSLSACRTFNRRFLVFPCGGVLLQRDQSHTGSLPGTFDQDPISHAMSFSEMKSKIMQCGPLRSRLRSRLASMA